MTTRTSVDLISAKELAGRLGFARPGDAFRAFCCRLGIHPIRRNPHYYDPAHVRFRLDQAQEIGMTNVQPKGRHAKLSLVEQRRNRLA